VPNIAMAVLSNRSANQSHSSVVTSVSSILLANDDLLRPGDQRGDVHHPIRTDVPLTIPSSYIQDASAPGDPVLGYQDKMESEMFLISLTLLLPLLTLSTHHSDHP